MNTFLPNNYEVPMKVGNYMRFEDGVNRFRILSSPIIGWETWVDTAEGGRKPLRRMMDKPFSTSEVKTGDPNDIKHFWAMPVWNYQEQKVQILEITQKSIQKSIKALAIDKDWGSPLDFDIVVTKTGHKLETEYEVQPKPAKPLDEKIQMEHKKMNINLNALYEGKDPFTKQESAEPKMMSDEETTKLFDKAVDDIPF